MSNLIEHAKRELKLAGINSPDADYDGALYKGVMSLVNVFAGQHHSGASAYRTLELFQKVASFENLMPIGTTKDEWVEVGKKMWQNKRCSAMFSKNNGKTWYHVDEPLKIFNLKS